MAEIVIGISALKRKLSDMSKNIQEGVVEQVLDSATEIEKNAIRRAPLGISNKIDKQLLNNGFAAEVGVQANNPIPIYIEFGTGTSAAQYVPTLPKEIQAYAKTFYVNGKGKIKKQPYLIPSFLEESPIFIKELKKLLKENV